MQSFGRWKAYLRKYHEICTNVRPSRYCKVARLKIYIYKLKLAVNMFKIKDEERRLGQNFRFIESERKGIMAQINNKSSEWAKNSLYYRGPIIWNCLDKLIRSLKVKDSFKKTLKSNKTLKKISFVKETTVNTNKDIENVIYY